MKSIGKTEMQRKKNKPEVTSLSPQSEYKNAINSIDLGIKVKWRFVQVRST